MKNIQYLGIISIIVFLFSVLSFDAFGCDSSSMDTAERALRKAKLDLEGLEMSKKAAYGSGMQGNVLDKLQSGISISDLNEQIRAQKKVVEAAEVAYSNALMAYMICYSQYLLEEITGPCGKTYKRLDRSDHALTYCYVYAKSYYKCEGPPCGGSSGSGSGGVAYGLHCD